MMTRSTPLPSQPSTVAMSSTPPPSCTGMPMVSRMRSTASALTALAGPGFHRRPVARAASGRSRNADGVQNAFDRVGVDRFAGEGAVGIDDGQIRKALHFEIARLRRRVLVKHGGARHVALLQAHGQTLFQIYGGKQDHGFH